MTGYGRSEGMDDGVFFRVEIRSVNHRFQEVMVRLPRELLQLEEMIKREVQSAFTRGRLDVFVTIEPAESASSKAEIDWEYVDRIMQSVRELKERYGLTGELNVSDIIHIPDIFAIREDSANVEAWREPLLRVVQEAISALLEMRQAEGAELEKILLQHIERIQQYVAAIRVQAPKVVENYRARINERVQEFLQGLEMDEARLLMEAALYAEKSNIDEELARLDSHCKQFRHYLSLDSPAGRKLDFLIQEMNREINTIGSKANDLTISKMVVEVKSELEKIREQVQNIE